MTGREAAAVGRGYGVARRDPTGGPPMSPPPRPVGPTRPVAPDRCRSRATVGTVDPGEARGAAMRFRDRHDAGRQLATRLVDERVVERLRDPIVLALPRGGVPVGFEVARGLDVGL